MSRWVGDFAYKSRKHGQHAHRESPATLCPNWSRTLTLKVYVSPAKACPLPQCTRLSFSQGLGCWHGTLNGEPATGRLPIASVILYSPDMGAEYDTSRLPSLRSLTSCLTAALPLIVARKSAACKDPGVASVLQRSLAGYSLACNKGFHTKYTILGPIHL